jgi:hypothetical protein
MKQVITGEEPDIATFEVPVNYNFLTNAGALSLRVDGGAAHLSDLVQGTNGNCRLVLNTTYEAMGQRYIQVEFVLNQANEFHVNSGSGSLQPFWSENMVRFFEAYSPFNTSASLYAQLPQSGVAYNYTIELRDPAAGSNAAPMKTFTGTTSTGEINENWDLVYEDGLTAFTNETFDATYTVTEANAVNAMGISTHPNSSNPTQPPPANTQKKHRTTGVIDGYFDVAYAYNPSPVLQKDGAFFTQMQGVVDKLMAPRNGFIKIYESTFNTYWEAFNPGNPGYLPDRATALNLLTNLAEPGTQNFYFFGHGNIDSIGDGQTNNPNRANLTIYEVARLLGNNTSATNGVQASHPYRFVFLDGCFTGKTKDWAKTFGIFDPATNGAAQTSLGSQAFLGWDDEVGGIRDANNVVVPELATAYGKTLNLFFQMWMSHSQVWACKSAASAASSDIPMPLPVKGNEKFTVNGVPWNRPTANLIIIGNQDLNIGN